MTTICDLSRQDNKVVFGLFEEMKGATTDDQRRNICFRLVQQLSMHMAIEEEVLYPLYKDKALGEKGLELHKGAVAEHLSVKKILYDLDQTGCDPKDAHFWSRWTSLMKDVTQHVREAEDLTFPYLEKTLPRQTLLDAGKNWTDVKGRMPTRPHPSAPAGSVFGDRILAAVDKARDIGRFGSKGAPDDMASGVHTCNSTCPANCSSSTQKQSFVAGQTLPKATDPAVGGLNKEPIVGTYDFRARQIGQVGPKE